MSGKFQLTVLKYRHSFIIGEIVNIGILFLFEDGEVVFRYPSKIGRISKLYDNISISFIKNSFASFKSMTSKLNRSQGNIVGTESSLKTIIKKYYLLEDAGSLLFSDIKSGIYENRDKTITYYYNLYLSAYEQETEERKSERYIIDQFRSIIKNRFSNRLEKQIKIEKTLSDEKRGISETFDYGWQNGKLNLVTPISFDLKDEQNLSNKSMKYFALFNVLKDQAIENKINFDLLVTKPREKALLSNYNKAVDFIRDSGAPIRVFEENEFDNYVDRLGDIVLNDKH